jgi:polyhydroxybutyrate depolymerase
MRTAVLMAVGMVAVGVGQAGAQGRPRVCQVELAVPAECATQGPAGTPFRPGANCRTVTVDGFPRQYLVYVPPVLPRRPPVVVMHHGSGGDGLKFLNISGWTEKADEAGLIAIFPTGLTVFFLEEQRCTTKWHAYGLEDEIDLDIKPRIVTRDGTVIDYPADAPWPADDLAFERAMLGDVRAGLDADPSRFYATGFSNGASFTARLSVEMADVYAAAAYSGGALGDVAATGLPPIPARRIPVVLQAGSCDPKVAEKLGVVFDAQDCASGQVEGIPLDPDKLLGIPQLAWLVALTLDTYGLAHEPHETVAREQSTCMAWSTPAGPPDAANVFQFTMLAGVTHQYPACNVNRCNNPGRFSAADAFWRFFNGVTACR